MAEKRTILVCSCEDTMPLDADALQRGCRGAEVKTARQLCRAELDRFRAAAAGGAPITVGCTQEAPLFAEVVGEGAPAIAFANVRETAGWSSAAGKAGPKMAALLAAAAEPLPDVPFVGLTSEGVTLLYGRDERAIEAANLLKDHLDITVLITGTTGLPPPRVTDFPVVKGTIRSAQGYLGAFELVVDDYAAPKPSSRSALQFGPARDGAVSRCDLVLDLSGGAPLFPAADLRDGYLRADPNDPAAMLRAVLKARDLVGTFDKPRYVTFTEDLCAHSRSKIVGCRRCLDLCPTGAITPAGDHVAIDAQVCAGCGQCAAACPTGAAAYALPSADALMRKLRVLLSTYREAGGVAPILLLHDEAHGGALIDALARHGDGLPANVLPLAVNEVTQIGLETVAAAFAYGASALRFLLRARPRHDITGLANTIALARHHWHRMHGLPRHVAFHLQTPGYWEKDDHDTLSDDCWPTLNPKKMLPLTFTDGLAIFREQVPMSEKTYRSVRWGKALQVWMTEGRDFRSPNNAHDGPDKSIWGKEQKEWLLTTLRQSDADFKVLVSPTPLVGPDRPKKSDNHSNAAFRHEGDEFRQWAMKNLPKNFFVVCGDRHWQYHSVHPQTGLHEFGTGAASDPHAGGTPGEDKNYHRFHRVKGGFVSVTVRRVKNMSTIVFRHHDVMGKVVHEYQADA